MKRINRKRGSILLAVGLVMGSWSASAQQTTSQASTSTQPWKSSPRLSNATYMRGQAGLATERIQPLIEKARSAYVEGRQQAAVDPLQSVLIELRGMPALNKINSKQGRQPAAEELTRALAGLEELTRRLSRGEVGRVEELDAANGALYLALARFHYERAHAQLFPGAAGNSPATAEKDGRDIGAAPQAGYRVGLAAASTTQTTPTDMPNPAWRATLQDHVRQSIQACQAALFEQQATAQPALAEAMEQLSNWSRPRPPQTGPYVTANIATAFTRFGHALAALPTPHETGAPASGDGAAPEAGATMPDASRDY